MKFLSALVVLFAISTYNLAESQGLGDVLEVASETVDTATGTNEAVAKAEKEVEAAASNTAAAEKEAAGLTKEVDNLKDQLKKIGNSKALGKRRYALVLQQQAAIRKAAAAKRKVTNLKKVEANKRANLEKIKNSKVGNDVAVVEDAVAKETENVGETLDTVVKKVEQDTGLNNDDAVEKAEEQVKAAALKTAAAEKEAAKLAKSSKELEDKLKILPNSSNGTPNKLKQILLRNQQYVAKQAAAAKHHVEALKKDEAKKRANLEKLKQGNLEQNIEDTVPSVDTDSVDNEPDVGETLDTALEEVTTPVNNDDGVKKTENEVKAAELKRSAAEKKVAKLEKSYKQLTETLNKIPKGKRDRFLRILQQEQQSKKNALNVAKKQVAALKKVEAEKKAKLEKLKKNNSNKATAATKAAVLKYSKALQEAVNSGLVSSDGDENDEALKAFAELDEKVNETTEGAVKSEDILKLLVEALSTTGQTLDEDSSESPGNNVLTDAVASLAEKIQGVASETEAANAKIKELAQQIENGADEISSAIAELDPNDSVTPEESTLKSSLQALVDALNMAIEGSQSASDDSNLFE